MTKSKRMLLWISVIIIIAGIIVTCVSGVNKGTIFKDMRQVKIYIATDVDVNKIREITDQVFGDQPVAIQKVELFNDKVAITTETITDEQLADLIDFTNQEYGLENSASTTEVITIPGMSLRDVVIPYLLPLGLSFIIILVYIGIKAKVTNQNLLNAILTPLCWTIFSEGVFLGIVAIFRMPIDQLTMPILFAIMVTALTAATFKVENIKKEN